MRLPVALALLLLPAPALAAALPAADQTAAFKAAGFKQVGRQWKSGNCEGMEGASYMPGAIETVADLNGDGRPEAVLTEGSGICYGNTGQAFWLMSKQADGAWKLMVTETGMASFLKTKGAGGWPDLSVGGPGFCFPVLRWNGQKYVLNRREYEGRACR